MLRSAVFILLLFVAPGMAAEVVDYPIQPVTFEKVAISEGMWADRLATNRGTTLPVCFQKCEETGRIQNFEVAAGLKQGGFAGIFFNDSDVFKIMEGAAYSLTMKHDPELDAYLDGLIAKIAAAQEEDGYLYTARTIGDPKYNNYPGHEGRWTHCRDGHELYNVGHMYEAAVAHFQATGKRTLLDVAIKSADLVCEVFGDGEGQRVDVPGHQEIEMGLVKLYRVTGERKYLDQARFFLEMRGQKDKRGIYGVNRQDHLPVKEQTEAVGHAVRAGYMYAGMADVAAMTGDQEMNKAIDTIWENIVSKKMYLTGGIGARRHGEAFDENYLLPNDTAYNETCAAIAHAMFNHRMFLLHGHAKYMDVVERIVYNGFLSGVSLEGDTFFYPNPLSSDGKFNFNFGLGAERSPWFSCSCCPANIVRFVPSIPGYMYAVRDDNLYVNLFAAGSAEVEVDGHPVKVTQKTEYPWKGRVEVVVEPEGDGREFTLRVRVPGWARGEVVPGGLYQESGVRSQESGKSLSRALSQALSIREAATGKASNESIETENLEDGYLVIRRKWAKGDTVVLDLPLDVRRVVCNQRVEANRGRVAFERGPIVYCAEAADHGGRALDLWVPDEAVLQPEHRPDFLGGVTVLRGEGRAAMRDEGGKVVSKEKALKLIPYYAWNHRGANEMRVWLPSTEKGADPSPAPTIASESRVSASHLWKADQLEALNDQFLPTSSSDHGIPRFTWWDHKGGNEWVQYVFEKPAQVSSVEVYWFDDTGRGACRVPAAWKLLYRKGGEWLPVKNTDAYGTTKDQFNRVAFEAVETDALRIEAQLQDRFSGGILEWRVNKDASEAKRWSAQKANQWYAAQPWRVGCNFIPSTAINQLEMWQADTWDPETIDRELKWAAGLGMNTVRVYLHDLAWEADAGGFKKRIDAFLNIASKHGIKPLFVLFDDCWNDNPKIGKQPEPIPSVHNSGWLQSPGRAVVNDPAQWDRLERYVKDIVGTYADDPRILLWDLYNEPGNSGQGTKSLPLLKKTFEWARAAKPSQPLSAGVWHGNQELNDFQLAASDIITFHNYRMAPGLSAEIQNLKRHGRPLICTEWLRRGHSDVANCMPIFKKANVGCINWGLVSGKTQTIWPWGTKEGSPEPERWFHDLLRKDGTPFDPKEAELFRSLTQADRVISTASLRRYVQQFNAVDEEEGVNTIHNKDAFGFLAENIPLFECPDEDFQRTYYYRWWTYRKHIRKTEDGYVVTEFYPNVDWAKKHNTINCPVGHQIYEGRWLRDPTFVHDYIKFHFGEGGNPGGETKHYSNWLTDAIYAHYLTTGDKDFVVGLLDDLIANHRAYRQDGPGHHSRSRYLEDIGLYWQIDSWDGGEFSIGSHGVRPTINSYLYGSAVAIANIAELAGKREVAAAFREEANSLKQAMQQKLWDPKDEFFKVLRDRRATGNYPNRYEEKCAPGSLVRVRELYGYAPWYFNMPDAGKGYEAAWAQLSDPQGFKGKFGPGFAERRHPQFFINGGGCIWSGSSWPLATSQTLTALANVLNNYEQDVIGKQEYFDTLRAYTRSHVHKREDGEFVPWVDESLNQDTGRWIMVGRYPKTRGRYYNHSSYCDLIITGLVGLRPRADDVIEVNPLLPENTWDFFCLDNVLYRGHILTIIWDKTGEKYGKGKGLTVLADGKKIAHSEGLSRITGSLKR